MAIDGIQPAIPENPPPQSKDQLITDSVDPAAKLKSGDAKDNKLGAVLGQVGIRPGYVFLRMTPHPGGMISSLFDSFTQNGCLFSQRPIKKA